MGCFRITATFLPELSWRLLFLPSIFRNDLRACSFAVTRHLIPPPPPPPTGDNLHLIAYILPHPHYYRTLCIFLKGDFCMFSVLYNLFWHCLICHPSDSTVSEDAGSEPKARIFKRLWSPGIDSKELIPPAYVAWRAGTITLFLLGS